MSSKPLGINQMPMAADPEYVIRFTDIYRLHEKSHPALREAECLKVQYPKTLVYPKEGDQFVGRKVYQPIGFDADMYLGYYFNQEAFKDMIGTAKDSGDLNELQSCYDYWKHEQTRAKIRKVYPASVAHTLPSDNHLQAEYPAYPLYRLAGTIPDFSLLLTDGIEKLRKTIGTSVEATSDKQTLALYRGFTTVLDILKATCLYYAEYDRSRGNISRAELLERISTQPPKSTYEALQLVWLYLLISGQQNFGRMDEYLGPYVYQDDIAGNTSRNEQLQLICSFWKHVEEELNLMNGRIVIGGDSRVPMEKRILFSLLAVEASRRTRVTRPQLSLRWSEDIPSSLWSAAIESIGEGSTFPILYNDRLVTDSVAQSFHVSKEIAQSWVPYGCGEYVLSGISFGSPNSLINILKSLELALNDGKDSISGKQMGPETGKRASMSCYDDLFRAYCAQVEYCLKALIEAQWISYQVTKQECEFLAISLLQTDCMVAGKGLLENESVIKGGLVESYGNVNTAESLRLINHLVYETGEFSLEDIWQAMLQGKESMAALLQTTVRTAYFGNGNEDSDAFMQQVHNHICLKAAEYGEKSGFDYYRAVIINNWNNTVQGSGCIASIDGRDHKSPLVSGYGAIAGKDEEGLPALLRSLSRLDPYIHAGAVHNLKIDKFEFSSHVAIYGEVFKVFFRIGGIQLMITCTSGKELIAAYNDPSSYPNLIVRVGGFTARFVSLPKEVQLEIINRTDVAYA